MNDTLFLPHRSGNHSETPDFDLALEVATDKMFENWGDFKRKVLDKARDEINEISDLHVDYILKKSGQGDKVHAVQFIVSMKEKHEQEKPAEMLDEIAEGQEERS